MPNPRARSKEHSLSTSRTLWHPRNVANRSSGAKAVASAYMCLNDRGQVRFYGYTSNIPLVRSTQPVVSDSARETAKSNVLRTEALADAVDLQMHLVELYFTYQDPALPIVRKDIFMAGWALGIRTSYFTKFLLHSILARSSRMSDRPDAALAMPVYQRRARTDILDEVDDPVVATIQALCIYGQFLTSLGNESACWLYPGRYKPPSRFRRSLSV